MKKEDKLVIKSNSLIDMQTDLKLTQLKIFTKVIMQTVKEPSGEFCRFSIQELMKEFHMVDSNHTALKKATAGMIKAVILKNQNGTTALVKSGDSFNNELLGASLQQLSSDELHQLNISNGLKITEVNEGILKRGGITRGFVITEINGVKINSGSSLQDALQRTKRNIVHLKGMYPNGVRITYEFML